MNTKAILIVLGVMFLVGIALYTSGWSFSLLPNVVTNQEVEGTSTFSDYVPKAQTTEVQDVPVSQNTPKVPVQVVLSDILLISAINNSLIRVPQTGVDVPLVGGSALFVDSSVKGKVSIDNLLRKVQTDDGIDVFVAMTVTIEGRPALMRYVAVFNNKGQSVSFKSSVLVGDRLIINSITAYEESSVIGKPLAYMLSSTGYVVTISYLDRKNGEAFTTVPSLLKTVSMRVKNHVISK